MLLDVSFAPRVGDAFTPGRLSSADVATSRGQGPPRVLTRVCFGLGLPSFGGHAAREGSSEEWADACPPR